MSKVIVESPRANQVVAESCIGAIATIIAQGPQGPPGQGGIVVDEAAKVDKSVLYYDAVAASFKADATWTISTLTDGGNF